MTPELEKALREAVEALDRHEATKLPPYPRDDDAKAGFVLSAMRLVRNHRTELLSLIEGQRWQPMVNPPKTDEFWLWDGRVVTKVSQAHQSAGRNSPMKPGYIRWDTDEFFTELRRDWKFIEIREPTPPAENTDAET